VDEESKLTLYLVVQVRGRVDLVSILHDAQITLCLKLMGLYCELLLLLLLLPLLLLQLLLLLLNDML
jgi:hypothetical protein